MNRVGRIDDAFLSRATVVLHYDHLSDDTRRKIWQGFINRLEEDTEKTLGARKIEVDKYAQRFVIYDEAVTKLRWNGREIQNVLQCSFQEFRRRSEGRGGIRFSLLWNLEFR